MSKSRLESRMEIQLEQEGLGPFAREYRWHPQRKWRADFAWPAKRVMLEVEGAVWTGGRHTFGSGFRDDAIKYAEAALAGWLVIRASPDMVRDRTALHLVVRALRKASEAHTTAGELRPEIIGDARGASGLGDQLLLPAIPGQPF